MLPNHLIGRLVGSQSAPDRVPQPAGLGELAVRNLPNQRRPYPMGIARILARNVGERRGLPAQLLKHFLDLIELTVVEPRSPPADVVQAGLAWYSHQQRPDTPTAAALALSLATDHDILNPMQFDLEPGMSAPTRLIDRIAPFGDHSLELQLIARLHSRLKIAFEDRRYLDQRSRLRL